MDADMHDDQRNTVHARSHPGSGGPFGPIHHTWGSSFMATPSQAHTHVVLYCVEHICCLNPFPGLSIPQIGPVSVAVPASGLLEEEGEGLLWGYVIRTE